MKVWQWSRKAIISIVGLTVVVIGLILIPLPGPGLLITAGGLAILALEYDWAKRYYDRAKQELEKIIDQSKSNQSK